MPWEMFTALSPLYDDDLIVLWLR
jgi:transposase